MKRYLAIVFVFAMAVGASGQVPALEAQSRLRQVIENYEQDRGAYGRWYSAETSPARRERFRQLYSDRLAELGRIDFARLEHHERVDHILFQNHLRRELAELERNARNRSPARCQHRPFCQRKGDDGFDLERRHETARRRLLSAESDLSAFEFERFDD